MNRCVPASALALSLLLALPAPGFCLDDAALEDLKSDIASVYGRGAALYDSGDYGAAFAEFEAAFRHLPVMRAFESYERRKLEDDGTWYTFADCYLYAGRSRKKLGDDPGAIACLDVVRELVPYWDPIYDELADIHERRGDRAAVKAVWEACVAAFATDEFGRKIEWSFVPAKAYDRLGALALADGDYAAVVKYGEAARTIHDERRILPLMNAGLASLLSGDGKRAVGFYADAVADAVVLTRPLLRQGIRDLLSHRAALAPAAGPLSRFALWALADGVGDTDLARGYAAEALADAAVPAALRGVADAEAGPSACWLAARLLALSGDDAGALAALGRAAAGSSAAVRGVALSTPELAPLASTQAFAAAFPERARPKPPSPTPEDSFEIVVQTGHRKMITGMAPTPDGRFVVTSSGDRTVRLWTKGGALVKTYRAERGLSCVAVSPDGNFIAAGTEAGVVKRWSLDGTALPDVTVPDWPVNCVALSPDGSLIATSSNIVGSGDDFAIRLHSADGRALKSFMGHYWPASKIAFDAEGRRLASIDPRGALNVWDTVTGRRLFRLEGGESTPGAIAFGFAPDGGLWIAGTDGTLYRVGADGSGRRELRVDGFGEDGFRALVDILPSADGAALTLVGSASAMRVDAATGARLSEARSSGKTTIGARLSDDGTLFLIEAGASGGGAEAERTGVRVVGKDGQAISDFALSSGQLVHADASPDGTALAAVYDDRTIRVFRTDGSLASTFAELRGDFQSVRWNADGTMLVASDNKNDKLGKLNVNVSLWQPDGALRKLFGYWYGVSANTVTLESGYNRKRDAWFVPGSGNLVLAGGDTAYVYDQGGNKVGELPFDLRDYDATPNGLMQLLLGNGRAELRSGGGVARTFEFSEETYTRCAAVSADGTRIAFGDGRGTISLGAPDAAEPVFAKAHREGVNDLAFSPDGKLVASCSDDGTIKLWTADGAPVRTLEGHHDAVLGVKFVRGGERLFSYSDDGTMGLWDPATGACCFIAAEDGEWIIFTPDGYFDCSKKGGDLAAMVKGGEDYAIDQFALARNRPDIILERLGLGEAGQADHYRAQFRRRIAKLGYLPKKVPADEFERSALGDLESADAKKLVARFWTRRGDVYVPAGAPGYAERLELMESPGYAGLVERVLASGGDVPEARIVEARTVGAIMELKLEFSASATDLFGYNVYVNGVPLYPGAGRPLSGRLASATETVRLGTGDCVVEVGCFNESLMESYRVKAASRAMDRDVFAPAPGGLWFVGFGVSEYRDRELDLAYAKKDVLDLATALEGLPGFGSFHKFLLTDGDATKDNIAKAKTFLEGAGIDDTVVLFISGHGVHDGDPDATYYYLTHDAETADLPKTAAPFELVEDLLVGIGPRRKLLLIDTCESGDIEAGALDAVVAGAGSKGLAARTAKPGGLTLGSRKLKAPRAFLAQRDRFVYNDLTRRSGAIVFSSCGGGELSYESPAFENGLFTEKLMEALGRGAETADADGDGYVATVELEAFVSREVAVASTGLQHPTVDRDNPALALSFEVSREGRREREYRTELAFVEGGRFEMGIRGNSGTHREHAVELASFLIAPRETTVGEFDAFVRETGYVTALERQNSQMRESEFTWRTGAFASDPALPVVGMRQEDAARYCNWLSGRDGLDACYSFDEDGRAVCDATKDGYRLPSEAEWEYAARGGLMDPGSPYAGGDDIRDVAWYSGNSRYATHPVGTLAPNALGLYDLSGNAFELCEDWYAEDYYAASPRENPRGPESGWTRVVRGGSWVADEDYADVRVRQEESFWGMQPVVGFRVARNAPEGEGR